MVGAGAAVARGSRALREYVSSPKTRREPEGLTIKANLSAKFELLHEFLDHVRSVDDLLVEELAAMYAETPDLPPPMWVTKNYQVSTLFYGDPSPSGADVAAQRHQGYVILNYLPYLLYLLYPCTQPRMHVDDCANHLLLAWVMRDASVVGGEFVLPEYGIFWPLREWDLLAVARQPALLVRECRLAWDGDHRSRRGLGRPGDAGKLDPDAVVASSIDEGPYNARGVF